MLSVLRMLANRGKSKAYTKTLNLPTRLTEIYYITRKYVLLEIEEGE